MTKDQIDDIAERVSAWPEEAQQDLAKSMENIEARYLGIYVTDPDERRALEDNRSRSSADSAVS